jgi:Bacterial PH domain
MIDFSNKTVFKLKRDGEFASSVKDILLDGEEVIASFKALRDGVVFTSKRIIAINVQGFTGKKRDFTSLPYKSIVVFSVETAGTFDLDSELDLYFSGLGKVRFEFTGATPIKEISKIIADAVFGTAK